MRIRDGTQEVTLRELMPIITYRIKWGKTIFGKDDRKTQTLWIFKENWNRGRIFGEDA
ncbi:MAG: hypothetical protein OXU36_03630 [Candidatus Poribacteria bacterium]|nr:hypothetical protein [Candidatus Poribacteria bacterium]